MERPDLLARDPRILRALQYFDAVARLGSVSAAAKEAGVSPSAISHQLRSLTGFLGENLFVKAGRGIVLSDAGQRLHSQVSVIFQSLGDLLVNVVGDKKKVLRLAVCSSFGPAWIAPRLPEFMRRNPDIDIELRLYAQDPTQSEEVADAVVTAGEVKAGFDSVTLFEEHLVAVTGRKPSGPHPHGPERLITTDLAPAEFGNDWRAFSDLVGRDYVAEADQPFLRCTHYLLALSLAKAGMGMALVPDFLAAGPLATGEVLLHSPKRIASGRVYRLCYKSMRSNEAELRELARWMKSKRDMVLLPVMREPAA